MEIVKITEKYRDHLVCKGKLVFVNSDEPEVIGKTLIMNDMEYCAILQWSLNEYPSFAKWRKVKPIIISETEKFGIGDTIAHNEYGIGKIISPKGTGKYWVCDFNGKTETVIGVFKVLALPEHFSLAQYEAIVNSTNFGSRLGNNDDIFLICEVYLPTDNGEPFILEGEQYGFKQEYRIKLTSGHINIIKPYKKEIFRTPMLDFLREYLKRTPKEQVQKEWDEVYGQVRNGETDEYAYGEKSIEALPEKICVNCGQKTDAPHEIDEHGNCVGAWNDITQEYLSDHPPFSGPYPNFIEWLKDNYNAPTKKRK